MFLRSFPSVEPRFVTDGNEYDCDLETHEAAVIGVSGTHVVLCTRFLNALETFTVTRIDSARPRNDTKLQSIAIPDTVTVISENAFLDSRTLETVAFEAHPQLREIGPAAFCRCTQLAVLSFPRSLRRICRDAFMGCVSLLSLEFQDDSEIEEIDSFAFAHCRGLKHAELPDSLVSIGRSVFLGCAKLESVSLGARFAEPLFVNCVREIGPVFLEISEKSLRQFRPKFANLEEIQTETITVSVQL